VISSQMADALVRAPMLPISLKLAASNAIENATDNEVDGFYNALVELQANSGGLPERLLTAISTGEIPSLCDISSADEVKQIIDAVESRTQAVSLIIRATEAAQQPLHDHVILQLLDSEPSAAGTIIKIAWTLVDAHHWQRPVHLVLLIAQHAPTKIRIEELVAVLGKCTSVGLGREALDLFIEAGLAERWAPLYEALRALAEDDASRLDGLAPEMRPIARAIYSVLRISADLPPASDAGETAFSSAPPVRKPAAEHASPQDFTPTRDKRSSRKRSTVKRR
jgi:hypothetical protein